MDEFSFEDLGSLGAECFPNSEHIATDADEGETIVQTTLIRER